MIKKLIIAGGSGYLGKVLVTHFKDKALEIIIFTRGKTRTINGVQYIHWDATSKGVWSQHLEGTEVLINLSGKSVDCRYSKRNRERIRDSRMASTMALGEAVTACKQAPRTWINSSTATIYRHSIDLPMDEETGEIGSGFSVNVAKDWESAFFQKHASNCRKVALRTSIVLGKKGGALVPIKYLTLLGFGGKQGNGNQMFSWIHEHDFARSIEFIIKNKAIQGPVNLAAPITITNQTLMNTMRKILKIPFGIPLNKVFLEIGAFCIRTETELLLKSRYVIPKKLKSNGFQFKFPELEMALRNILK